MRNIYEVFQFTSFILSSLEIPHVRKRLTYLTVIYGIYYIF